MNDKKVYLVDTINMFNIRYVVEVDANETEESIRDMLYQRINDGYLDELSQRHICDQILSIKAIKTDEQYIDIFDENNPHLSHINGDRKRSMINCLSVYADDDDEEQTIFD